MCDLYQTMACQQLKPGHPNTQFEQRTSSAGAADHQTELNTLLDILLTANLNLPTEGSSVSSGDFFWGKYGARVHIQGKHTALRADDMVG